MKEIERIAFLRRELHRHNELYYVRSHPEISDTEFDSLMHELEALEHHHPELYDANSPTQRIGSDLSRDFIQVEHERPMLSLGNTYNREDVKDFYDGLCRRLGVSDLEICCEQKFDGLSISLIYDNGILTRAVTRGDGVKGDDVTYNVRTIRSIPLQIVSPNVPDHFEVRGEILLPWSSFNALNDLRKREGKALFANPRNAASGTLKSKSSKVVSQRGLDAYFYYLLTPDININSHYELLQQLSSWGFKVSQHMQLSHSLSDIYQYIDYWDEARHNLPVATDGIVLKVNDRSLYESLGITAKSPRWAIAYKFKAERAQTYLRNVVYQVGRTGAVTPVAEMDPVLLAGTVVRRASLHNADVIRLLQLHLGDRVYVEKAGEIIPQIVAREYSEESSPNPIEFITNCPECGTALIRYEGEAAHYCPNDTGCPPQLKGRIVHFISRDAMDISSLGPETIDTFFEEGWIRTPADLYLLTVSQLCGEDGNRQKSAEKIVEAVAESRERPFNRVLYALGIRFVGKVAAKKLAEQFRDIDHLRTATEAEIASVEGIGEVIAKSVVDWMKEERNKQLIDALQKAGLSFSMPEKEQKGTLLNGASIVVSGKFIHHTREEYKAMIEAYGGKNVSSISKRTTFILAGDKMGPSKLEKAKTLGIKIFDEQEFLNKIHEGNLQE